MVAMRATVDIRQPLQPVYVDTRYSHLLIVASWGHLPLGTLLLDFTSGPRTLSVERLHHELLSAFGWPAWQHAVAGDLNALSDNAARSLPGITVVVCTRDRSLSLGRCLQALTQLDYPQYEVVVVDNCSTQELAVEVVAQSGFRYVREDNPGLDRARSRGIQEAKHSIIAFIDDDALAAPGWLRGVALGFEDPEIMAVTGLVLPAEIESQAQQDFEAYGGMSKGMVARTIRRNALSDRVLFWASNWGVGTNMAFRRALFDAIGDFDVALDVGTPTSGGGDLEFFYRAVAAGYALHYEPAAMVYHLHRRDDAALQQQIFSNGRSFGAYLLTIARNEPQKRARVVGFALRWWLWDWLLQRVLRSLTRRDGREFRLGLTELLGACTAPWAYWESQRAASKPLHRPGAKLL